MTSSITTPPGYSRNTLRRFLLPVSAIALLLAGTAGQAQDQPQTPPEKHSTAKDAGEIVSQPVRDVGLAKTRIPPLLEEVSEDPYGMYGAATCAQISRSIANLTGVLGPDFSTAPVQKKGNVAKAGGAALVNSLIPFRGLVREVSGAAPAERRLNAAIDAGYARRGFLRGLKRARGCR